MRRIETKLEKASKDEAWQDRKSQGKARRVKAGRGKVRRDETKHNKARLGEKKREEVKREEKRQGEACRGVVAKRSEASRFNNCSVKLSEMEMPFQYVRTAQPDEHLTRCSHVKRTRERTLHLRGQPGEPAEGRESEREDWKRELAFNCC